MRTTSPSVTSAFVFVCFLSCLLAFMPIATATTLFTVDNIEVDVTDDNALSAREKAFDEAQILAFKKLVARLSPSGYDQMSAAAVDINSISSMIKDYEILDEKISNVRYVGNYTFRFRASAVKKFFSGKSLNYSDLQSEPVMILPFYQMNGRYDLWSYNNLWKSAWDRSGRGRALVPIVVPVGDLQDVSDMRDDQALSYEYARLQNLIKRYGAKEAVIAVAVPDSGFMQVLQSGGLVQGSLIIHLYRTDGYTPVLVKQFYVQADPSTMSSSKDVFDIAVERVQKLLRDNWKAQTMVNAGNINQVQLRIPLGSLQEWIKISKKLKALSTVNDVVVKSMSSKRVLVALSYEGDINRLQLSLSKAAMKMAPLSVSDVNTEQGIPVYELVRK